MVTNQGKGVKGVFYLSELEGLKITQGSSRYIFKDEALAKKYADEVEAKYTEYDLIVSVQEVELCVEGIKPVSVEKVEGGNEMNKQINRKISVWECECANCWDKRSIEVPQELTPRYCTQCGSETEYHEVAGYLDFSSEDGKHIDLTDSKAWTTTKLCMDGEVMSKIAKEVLAEMKKTRLTKTTEIETEISLDQEQLQTAQMILNAFAESGYNIKEATEILEFCKDSLRYSPVGTYEFEKE